MLQANFRNTQAVTQLANTLLKIKQARFGSIDRESNFLVHSTSGEPGEVTLVQAKDAALKQLDAATRASARHAVIVLRDEDKAAARAQFHTPLVFSVHEAKGLEYPHVRPAGHRLGPARGLRRGLRRRHGARPASATNSTTAAPGTRATSRSSCTSSTSTHCTWR